MLKHSVEVLKQWRGSKILLYVLTILLASYLMARISLYPSEKPLLLVTILSFVIVLIVVLRNHKSAMNIIVFFCRLLKSLLSSSSCVGVLAKYFHGFICHFTYWLCHGSEGKYPALSFGPY